ncbi:MAG: multifunctional CCA addition/repair protein [Gammaproteobacteria bacterium]|nr:multifunctional CCA addition/repair protein [Gammaproteobacteria bacterium]MDH3464297.1 multifunctional CCA addition/repair protein [Gammaproteobacteria bacterium]
MTNAEHDLECYLVGGAVRDRLLGLEVKDRDWIVVGATAESMVARGFKPVGKDFPVFLHPVTHDEYALARTERKTGPGYKGFSVYASTDVTLVDDLRRRDLTINAMAHSRDGGLIDPFGGAADLDNRILRHVSPAFAEDPVRILRVARFAARYAELGFTVADDTNALMSAMVNEGEVDALVAERVWTELESALGESRPSQFIVTLRECGALARIFPEIDRLFGIPQATRRHPEIDTGAHTLLTVDQAAAANATIRARYAALVHDLGKGLTPPHRWPNHRGHDRSGLEPIQTLSSRLRVPNSFVRLALLVCAQHLKMHRLDTLKADAVLTLLESLDALRRPEIIVDFSAACRADARGRGGHGTRPYPQAELLQRCCEAALRVNTHTTGLQGDAIGTEIRRRRVIAIGELLRG